MCVQGFAVIPDYSPDGIGAVPKGHTSGAAARSPGQAARNIAVRFDRSPESRRLSGSGDTGGVEMVHGEEEGQAVGLTLNNLPTNHHPPATADLPTWASPRTPDSGACSLPSALPFPPMGHPAGLGPARATAQNSWRAAISELCSYDRSRCWRSTLAQSCVMIVLYSPAATSHFAQRHR